MEILEFWLHEAMAQLQLGPLGESTSYMDENNIPLRSAFTSEFQARFDPNVEQGLNTVVMEGEGKGGGEGGERVRGGEVVVVKAGERN